MRLERSGFTAAYRKLSELVRRSLGLDRGLFASYANEFIQLACRECGPVAPERREKGEGGEEGEPDYTRPGKWGTRRQGLGKLFVWQDHLPQPYWLEIGGHTPPTCDDFVIEAWYGEFSGQCPPVGGFQPLVQKAMAKAVAEAMNIPCLPECPIKSSEVIYKEWYCAPHNNKPIAIVQAVRVCTSI